MKVRFAASLAALLVPLIAPVFSATARAAALPPILVSSSNKVPACVTPGRLMAFLSSRNRHLARKYKNIASLYMRNGEKLGLRWDYAFFQMMVETANLTYTGDVRAKQNNFAGLGATGGGVRGESFSSVSNGVLAHLQHVLMYTGKHIDNPVAERTRKVQSWGVLNKWRRGIRAPMTYTHLARQWAPPDRGYSRDIAFIGKMFFDKFCNQPDPDPGMLAQAGGRHNKNAQVPSIKTTKTTTVYTRKSRTATAAKAGASGTANKAGALAATLAQDSAGGGAGRFSAGGNAAGVNVAVLNAPKKDQLTPGTSKAAAGAGSKTKTKSKKPGTGTATAAKSKTVSKCKVWTASYGGPKALIIKAVNKGMTNYTVLDVNVGREKREANAYIKAYAKGGATVGEFASPEKALKHAFQLCPEG